MVRLLNFVGGAFFFLFGINFIVARYKGSKDGPHDNSQVSYFLCAVIVIGKAAFFFGKMIWDLKDTMSKVVLTSLSFETVAVIGLSYVIEFDKKYQLYLSLLQSLLPTFVVGSMAFLPLESRRKALDELKNIRNINTELCERIAKFEKEKKDLELKLADMKMENKKLNDSNKLLETDKKYMEIDIMDMKRLNKELLKANEEFQKVKEDSERKLEIVTAEVKLLKKVEDKAKEMKGKIKLLKNLLKNLHDHVILKVEEKGEIIDQMKNQNQRHEIMIDEMERAFVELRGIHDELKNENLGFRRDLEQACAAKEQESANAIGQPQ